ncbi:MAG: outer membrane protein assembly factor BamE [Alphaproteobacteria bacterium]|jgi:hypothetical protein|nr:outer membrane protein assembly factor BamE [Alphaproteobacteria bacterium]
MKKITLSIIALLTVTACQPQNSENKQGFLSSIFTPDNIVKGINLSTKIKKDMTKEEVLSLMGIPTSTEQFKGSEYMMYNSDLLPELDQDYFVELGSDQMVKSFGLVDNPYSGLPLEIYKAYK